jgi:hypothetical protein
MNADTAARKKEHMDKHRIFVDERAKGRTLEKILRA